MSIVANILVGLVAALHAYFLVLEMFLWTEPAGRKAFNLTPEFAETTKSLAANQGLYNGFLVAGLVWGLIDDSDAFKIFFLGCVVVAGVYGAATVNQRILVVQAVPAAVALVAVALS
jgi:putative membrane protein